MYDDIYTDADIEMAEMEAIAADRDAGLCVICGDRIDNGEKVTISDDRHNDCIDPETAAWLLDPTA